MKTQVIPYEFWAANQNKKNTTTYDNVIAQATSMEEAVFVRRFLWLYESKKAEGKGWVFIVPKTFAERVGMSVYAFRKIVSKWERLKIIRTRSHGLPLKKYYWLDEEALASYLSKIYGKSHLIEIDNLGLRNREDKVIETDKISNASKSLKRNTVAGAKSPGRRTPLDFDVRNKRKPKTGFSHDCAKKLYDALAKKGKVMRRPNLDNWASTFRKLKELRGTEEVTQVLSWYTANIGKPYVPQAYSAQSFHDKFPSIQDAMRNQKRDQTKEVRQQIREGTEDIQWPITWTDERGWKCEMFSDGSWGCTSPTDRKGRSTAQPHLPGDTYGLPEHLKQYTLAACNEQDEVYDDEGDIG